MNSLTDSSVKTYTSPRIRIPPLWIGILCILIVLIFAPLLAAMLAFGNDYPAHIAFAIRLQLYGELLPHFLYHVLLIIVGSVMPGNTLMVRFGLAAAIVGVACYIGLGLILFFQLKIFAYQMKPRLRWPFLVGLTLALLLVGPINELTWNKPNILWGYLTPNTYHNPTVVLLKPFALLLFGFSLRAFNDEKVGWKTLVVCGVVGILGTLAKPNYALALLPGLALVLAYAYLKKWRLNWRLVVAVILPIVGVLAWQLFFYGGDSGGFEIAPLKVMSFYSPDGLLPKFLLSLTFPGAVYILYFQKARLRLDLNLAWLVFGVAVAFAYLLAEGKNWVDGNFTWGTQIALFILFVLSVKFVIQQHFADAPRWKTWTCAMLFLLHLAGGIMLFSIHFHPGWQASL